MTVKKKNGFIGMDMVIAIVAMLIFSGLIFSLMYNNAIENSKIRKETMAIIYLTEILEGVGIADYDNISKESIDKGFLLPEEVPDSYEINIEIITDDFKLADNQVEPDIMKKVIATISYKVGNKDYKLSMERLKIKE